MTSAIPCCSTAPAATPHLAKFYRTALGNPALRPLLRRTGLSELQRRRRAATACARRLIRARDDAAPDWAAIGAPVAALLDTIELQPSPARSRPADAAAAAPDLAEIERVIRVCGAHLLRSFGKNGFIPTYAAFNLIGDPDLRGREFLMALTGLNARGYKNSTLLFNLARIFIARSPARDLINPPWKGIAEPMWQPMQIRHRSAYYDAFFTEALLSFVETGLASAGRDRAPRAARSRRWSIFVWPPAASRCARRRPRLRRRHRDRAAPASAVFAVLHRDQAGSRLRRLRAGLRHHGLRVLGGDAGRLRRSDARPAAAGFLRGYQVSVGANEPKVTVPINDNIDYEGGVVTWIDSIRGERPYRQRPRSDAQSRHPRGQLPQPRALEHPRDAAAAGYRARHHRASRSGWRQAAPSPIRARTSIICRSFIAPISAAAMPPSWRCRWPRGRRSIPTARSN